MPNVGQSWWQIIEQGLVSYITSATTGSGVLAVQPNPDGSTGIKLVSNVVPPEENIFPQIGIAYASSEEDQAAQGTHNVVATYDIVLAVRVDMDAMQPSANNAQRARTFLTPYMNDASGNGIEPFLRSQTFLTDLPGFQWGLIKHSEMHALQNDASAASVLAVAMYTYEVHGQVRIWGT